MLHSTGGASDRAPRLEAFFKAVAEMTPARRDATFLTGLNSQIRGKRPLFTLLTGTDPRFVQIYVDVLDRQGLAIHHNLVVQALAAFGPGSTDPQERFYQMADGRGNMRNPALNKRIAPLERAWQARPGALLAKTE